MLEELYRDLPGPKIVTDIEIAEIVKYVDNVWHALKVSFANEVGAICKEQGIDSHAVMDIFCQDTKLNISSYYMKPGFAFGGSCLPKDVRALSYHANRLDLKLPVLQSIMGSNRMQIDRAIDMVTSSGRHRVGILGFSFKAGTDDLRESPIVEVAERLIGKGYELQLYDRNVSLAKLVGANREYIMNQIPHISGLMVDSAETLMEHAEIVIVGNGSDEFADVIAKTALQTRLVIDLVPDRHRNQRERRLRGFRLVGVVRLAQHARTPRHPGARDAHRVPEGRPEVDRGRLCHTRRPVDFATPRVPADRHHLAV